MNVLDQQFLPWDRSEPQCILLELRVAGRLEADRVREAVRTAIAHHPMARARLASSSLYRGPRWEIVDRVEEIPLEVIDGVPDDALRDARSNLVSRPIDLRSSPPFALMLAHRAGGDSLSLSFSHAVADGVSIARLMRSIACAYGGLNDVIKGPDPLTAHDLSFYPGRSRASAYARQVLRLSRRRASRALPEIAKLAADSVDPSVSPAGFRGFQFFHLDRDETSAATAQRQPPATINDLLIASLALAVRRWNDARGLAPHPITVQMAINLRERDWSTDVVANLAKDVTVVVSNEAQRSLADAQLAIAEQTGLIKRRRALGDLDLPGPLNVLPQSLRYAAVTRLQTRPNRTNTIGLSNLGAIDIIANLGNDAGRVTELWFGPPGIASFGTLSGVLRLGGEMFFALHYRTAQFARTAVEEFTNLWREVLLEGA